MDDDSGAPRGLRAAGILSVALGLVYLLWRLTSPSECAWLTPSAAGWTASGIRPVTDTACGLQAGSTVTAASMTDGSVLLSTGTGQVVTLPLDPSGPLVASRLIESAWTLGFVVGFFALALYASWRRPRDRAAATTVVMSGALLGSTVLTVVGLPAHAAFAGPPRWVFAAGVMPLYLMAWGAGLAWVVVFPTPLTHRRRAGTYWAVAGAAPALAWMLAVILLLATSATFTGWMHSAIVVESSLAVVVLALILGIIAVRLKSTLDTTPGAVPRQQFLWVAGSFCVAAISTLALWMVPELVTGHALLPAGLVGAPGLVFVAGFGIAMIRYRLFDLDVVLARTLIYSGLTLAAVAVYLSASGVLAVGFQTLAPTQVAAIGAILVAVMVNPVRIRLERTVNRAFYGDRDEPYTTLTRVATSITDRGQLDGRIADDIRRAMRAPYVGILDHTGEALESGEAAALSNGCVEFPISHAGEPEGTLRVAVRGRGERFAGSERRLLEDIARQIGAGLHEKGLILQLQQSRERIVVAREEERRVLRRTLHDEVGPTMAALSLRAETVRRLVTKDGPAPAHVDLVLASISADASAASEVLRRLSYNLRPPALDECGLEGALRLYTQSVEDPAVSFVTDLGEEAAPLSAAVEAALYRITVGAVTNASRHAHAGACTVRLSNSPGCVRLTVVDDGRGLPANPVKGVGILAMQERAAELGGWCTVSNGSGGTVVCAEIPIGGRA